MVPRRLALLLLCLASLAPGAARWHLARPVPARPCRPEGRGVPPRGWVGCAADGAAPRDLTQRERLLLGLPVDLNRAGAEDLEWIPGLSRKLAAAVVADRVARGPFACPEELERVRGIGPVRMGRARPHVAVPGGGWVSAAGRRRRPPGCPPAPAPCRRRACR